MPIYNTGPGGTSIYVNNGALLVTTCPSGQLFPYKYGPGGQCINVDALGRLVVSLDGWQHVDKIEDDLSSQINGIKNEFTFMCRVVEPLAIYRNGVLCKIGADNDYVTWNIMPPSGVQQLYLSYMFSPTTTQYAYIRWEITAQEWLINNTWTAGLYVSNYNDIYYSYVSNGVYKNISSVNLSQLTHPIEILKIKLRRMGAADSASFDARALGFSIQYTR